ncbi:hypothetical protein EZV61_15220 [Corallincola luteus]|uniref:Uncharacterized protein n=1 Tax=Corallincola luteus TaxID=1775177 RepID=A0ABY2AI15_9GAMM|nr:hypothetical protein [Corallincola luteus]TCI02278.1 hypothetical protein EZV61_15220 [Corallincola luteus]
MNRANFLEKLNDIGFADSYYELCADFPLEPSGSPATKGKKNEVVPLFEACEQEVKYNGKFRMYELVLPKVSETEYSASLFFQRHGLEFTFGFKNQEDEYSTNLAVLSSEVKKEFEPSFSINPAYPRPDHNGSIDTLGSIIARFSKLIQGAVSEFEKNS